MSEGRNRTRFGLGSSPGLSSREVDRRLRRRRRPGTGDPRPSRADRRAGLVRDTVTILGAALITLVAWQMFGGASPGPAGTGSIQPIETSIDIRTFAVEPTLQPVPTLGLIANPSVGLGATPTPVPFATLRPR